VSNTPSKFICVNNSQNFCTELCDTSDEAIAEAKGYDEDEFTRNTDDFQIYEVVAISEIQNKGYSAKEFKPFVAKTTRSK
jgi:hypothetical protein